MLIRKPAAEVYNAFVDPAITTQFWFTKSSGKLAEGEIVRWEWEMYGVSADVTVRKTERDKRVEIGWGDPQRWVEFRFDAISETSTYVTITESGYVETGDDLIAAIKDSTGGFTTVLDGAKAYLEHGINLNLIADKFPSKT